MAEWEDWVAANPGVDLSWAPQDIREGAWLASGAPDYSQPIYSDSGEHVGYVSAWTTPVDQLSEGARTALYGPDRQEIAVPAGLTPGTLVALPAAGAGDSGSGGAGGGDLLGQAVAWAKAHPLIAGIVALLLLRRR